MYDKQIFAKNLKYYMEREHESQADIARLLGISKSNVTAYLAGKQIPRMDKVQTLSEHFGVSKSALIETLAPSDVSLSPDECLLLERFRQLDDDGKAFVLDNAEYALSRYPLKKDTPSQARVG